MPATAVVAGVPVPHPADVFIAGEWLAGEGGAFDVVSPATEQTVARVSLPSIEQARLAVTRADEVGRRVWSGLPIGDRVDAISRWCDLMEARFDEMGIIWAAEAGMSLRHSRSLHRYAARVAWRAALAAAETTLADEVRPGAPGEVIIRHEPAGVVVGIMSYNGPVVTIATKIIPALLAGCPVVVKGALDSQLILRIAAACAELAELPRGALSILCGGPDLGEALTADSRVDLVSLTGGHAAAQSIIDSTRGRFARTHFELGGKSAALVLPDADLDQVAKVLSMGSAAGTGQVCALLSRVIVPIELRDRLLEIMTRTWAGLVVGDPLDPSTTIGPLVNRAAYERTHRFLERALSEGGRIVAGGTRPEGADRGFYFLPTIVADVDRGSSLAQEEVFGPITAIITYDGLDDGIDAANDSDFGLSGAVFTRDRDAGIAVAARIRSGAVGVNVFGPDVTAPWGGVKRSGWGREGGPEGLLEFTETKQIAVDPGLSYAEGRG